MDGWDISKLNIGDSMKRAEVLDVVIQDQVYKQLALLQPRPSIYDPDFIAANQVIEYIEIKIWVHLIYNNFIYTKNSFRVLTTQFKVPDSSSTNRSEMIFGKTDN